LLLEEYGVTFEYLRKENFIADTLSYLEIDERKISQEEALTILSELEHIDFPLYTFFIIK
jgi:hypothetical protein